MSQLAGNVDEQFREARELERGGDYKQARRLLAGCVAADPNNRQFVDAFLANLGIPDQTSNQAQLAVGASESAEIGRALSAGNYEEVLHQGPLFLADYPVHLPTFFALAEASAAFGQWDNELAYLIGALAAGPGDVDVQRRAARALADRQQLGRALACWQQVARLAPEDLDAVRVVSQLTIELGRREAGLTPRTLDISVPRRSEQSQVLHRPGDGQARPVTADLAINRTPGGIKLTPIQQLEAAIRDQPVNAELYLRLVPLYLEKERDYDAERLLEKGTEATGDPRVRELWEDVVMRRMEKKIEYARREAERDDTPQSRAELAQLRAERDRYEIDAFTRRCQREPANLALRYELGLRLKRAGKLRFACQELQQALSDPQYRSPAALQLGECLAQGFEYPEALQHYRLAADSARLPEQLEGKKEALYRAAELALRVKLRRPAQRYLAELHQIDPAYRDAAQLLEKLPQVVV